MKQKGKIIFEDNIIEHSRWAEKNLNHAKKIFKQKQKEDIEYLRRERVWENFIKFSLIIFIILLMATLIISVIGIWKIVF